MSSSAGSSIEQIGDIVVWVDDTLRKGDAVAPLPASGRLATAPFNKMGSFVEAPVGAIDIPEMERRNMSLAECEQCALDDFWGMVANQVEQAEATAAMEREDQRSQDVRARVKKEEKYRIWEEEDLRKRETRSIVRENLEDAARREYLEIFYSAPSADIAMNYRWPTRASLGQALDQQLSDSLGDETEVALTQTAGEESCVTTCGNDGRGDSGSSDGCNARSALSTAQTSRDFNTDCSISRSSGDTGEESSSTRPFHIFRGKKAHQIIPVQDVFIPPRHLAQPMTKNGLISMHALAAAGCLAGGDPTLRPEYGQPAVAAPSGLCKAAHLPPMAERPRDNRLAAGLEGSGAVRGTKRNHLSLQKRPLTGDSPPQSSFERKLAARRKQWSREAEADAEERAFQEQWRTQELLRDFNDRDGGGKAGDNKGFRSQSWRTGGGCRRNRDSRSTRERHTRSRDWRGCEGGCDDEGKALELIPEREEQLLTEMFGMLDARNRGEVRLDEVLFYMTENAQVKSVLKQVTLWTLTKTRRWEWVRELLAAQPGRTLTLPALLTFSRSLYEESGVPREHLRFRKVERELDVERRDARSRRLLPADFVEGSEVEALFRKGFEWYRAWIVRCHPDDTFDVRFTRPSSPPSGDVDHESGAVAENEEKPEVDTCSRVSGSEEDWNSDEENNILEAEEEWKATCDSVARCIGIPPDLGETETEVLGKAFDAIASLVSPPQADHTPAGEEAVAKQCIGDENNPTACDDEGRVNDEHCSLAWRQQREEEKSARRGEGEDGSGKSSRQAGSSDALRIPARKIVSLLRAGAIDEYRRESPALSAAYIYRDFAEGLGAAARRGKHDARRANLGSAEHDHCPTTYRGTGEGAGPRQDEMDGCDVNDDERGSGWGVSKEEFCDYFEAVTDLVDLNGLSLVPQA